MRTRNIFRYLLAIIIALSTTVNVFAQEKTMKIYFKQNPYNTENNNTIPPLTKEDIILRGDIPFTGVDLKPEPEGVVWASGYRWFSGWHGTAKDRIIASYVDSNTKMDSRLKLSFKNFPFEVNAIQWNAMNDLLSGAIFDITEWDTDIFDNYTVKYAYTPVSGNAITGSEQNWDLNIFNGHSISFSQGDMPGASNMTLKGLNSLEFQEENYFKVALFDWITFYSKKTALNDNCRTFIKAGYDGKTEPDADDWAFSIKYSLPELGLRFTDGRANNVVYVDEPTQKNVQLQAYISAHPGAITPINSKPRKGDYYYEFVSGNTSILKIEDPRTGKIAAAYKSGSVDVTVNLKYMLNDNINDASIISSNTQTVYVLAQQLDSNAPEICIGFVNGKKGYDVTVGDEKVKIQGFITKGTKPDNSTFEYSEGSNDQIITINKTTGEITPLKEGDVTITAVLKSSTGTIVSYPYSYTLHVFAKHEGLEWQREDIYAQASSSNANSWKVGNNNSTRNWQASDYLKTKTTILENNSQQSSGSSTDSWKQIAWFKTESNNYWRAVCQKIKMDVHVPKYSKATATYRFAGNVTIGERKGNTNKYGFEVKDLGTVTSGYANTIIKNITWNTTSSSETISSSSGSYTTKTIARNGADNYTEYVGAGSNPNWETDNSTSDTHKTETRYLAVMAYLHNNRSYPGEFSVGYKDIPTYTYYSQVKYYDYQEDGTPVLMGEEKLNSDSKTATQKLNKTVSVPIRTGYTFMGWSTVKNGKTVVYTAQGDFCPYDDVNGGGKGPVELYAVWEAIPYTVLLNHNGGSGKNEQITVVYGQPMPEGAELVAPTRTGYDFNGYRTDKSITPRVFYYDENMKSLHNYDKTRDYTLYADWIAHTTKITFDFQGGNYGATQVTATYNQPMPTGAWAPQRDGYTFGGYYRSANGGGIKYYNADMTSANDWKVDEPEVTLYAYWIPITYNVTLNHNDGTGITEQVTASYGEDMPEINVITRAGYEFDGYWDNQTNGYGKQYYNADGTSAAKWDKNNNNTILYAHWVPKTYIVTLDADGGVLPKPVVEDNADNFAITKEESNSVMTIPFVFGLSKTNEIVHSAVKKPGYEFLGWYDSNDVKVIGVEESRNCTITDNGGYWTGGGKVYNYTDNLTLTAHYRKKYKYADNVITFGKDENGNPEKVEADEDWLFSVVNDLVGSAQEVYQKTGQQTMVFDLRESINRWNNNNYPRLNVMQSLQKEEYKDYISPNVLVYFNDNEDKAWYVDNNVGSVTDCYNAVSLDNKCKRLVVTDRYSIKIPTAFSADEASYARDAKVADGDKGKDQAKNSYWGTLCLPYPIKNNTNGVKFYWLESTANNYMEFAEFGENAIIPANTPVLYCRTDYNPETVEFGSQITIEEGNVGVPKNDTFTPVIISYSDPQPGTYPLESASETLKDWEFRGNLKTNIFYGAKYVGDIEQNAQRVDNGDVYYFKQNKFTHLTPAMVKNGVRYEAGKMTLYPYRAYFYKKGVNGSSAKVSAYSILVVGEDGNTTDITDAIFGDGEGDGKIYDLNGIRVMQPVKGRLYIVNGQKKVYR